MNFAPDAQPPFHAEQALRLARETFEIEAAALQGLAARVDTVFAQAVQKVLQPNDLLLTQGAGNVGAISVELAQNKLYLK